MSSLEKQVDLSGVGNFIHSATFHSFSIDRKVALGVQLTSRISSIVWFVFDFSDKNQPKFVEIRERLESKKFDDELGVEFVVYAKMACWVEIGQGGHKTAVLACDSSNITVTGKLPYFIRHARACVDLMVEFGAAILQATGA